MPTRDAVAERDSPPTRGLMPMNLIKLACAMVFPKIKGVERLTFWHLQHYNLKQRKEVKSASYTQLAHFITTYETEWEMKGV